MKPDQEFAKLWEPGLPGIELFSARLIRHTFSKHIHEAYTIGINQGGQGSFLYRGEPRCAYPGSFNLLNPGEVHTGQPTVEAGWIYRNIYISVPLIEKVVSQLEWQSTALPYFAEPVVWDESLQASLDELFQTLSQPTAQLERESLLLVTLSHFLLKHAERRYTLQPLGREATAIAKVRAYLEAYYAEEVSIDALAQLVGLSSYYLIRSFRQHVGLPPHAYQLHLRLLQAKRALRTSKPITEVALEHGFYDQSHLTRYFKRIFGMTPGQYRESNSVQDC